MKIYKGIIKKVPSEEHFKEYSEGNLDMSDLRLEDTIIRAKSDKGEFDILPIRLSYREVDKDGNEKYIYDEGADAYIKTYSQTPVLYAHGKEMRILCELGEYSPVKLVVTEEYKDDRTFLNIECVQNQHSGLEPQLEMNLED
ncbi:hypothetical protein RZE82_07840 [Mollicutes bacterium LVI A0039]|nr:hypothetical protein RZE82_07840 [Mollicutes bacterium LVI A0039]